MGPIFLCIETATYQGSVALAQGDAVLGAVDFPSNEKHIKNISQAANDLLRGMAVAPGQLSAIGLSAGPGSYTGLRIGASFAKGLAFGLGIPLIAMDSLRIMAQCIWKKYGPRVWAAPMLDARRMEVYTAVYHHAGAEIWPTQALVLQEGGLDVFREQALVVAGTGCPKAQELYGAVAGKHWVFDPSLALHATSMAGLVASSFERQAFANIHLFEPSYLKEFRLGTAKGGGLAAP